MADIFVSYDDKDRPRARALVAALERQGWSVFWDRSVPAGKNWWQAIGRALKGARGVVVLWSRTAVHSTWVYEEAEDARKRGILIPVFIDPVHPPIGLRSVQAVDLSGWDGSISDPSFQKLLADIASVVGDPGSTSGSDAASRHQDFAAPGEIRDPVEHRRDGGQRRARGDADDGYSSRRFYLLLAGLILGCVLALYLWG